VVQARTKAVKVSAAELALRQRFAALARGLAGARAGDVNGIHQARVATRRLREALPLVAAGAAGRKLERMIRRLTRALGPVRELDVALQTLDELQQSGDAPPAAFTCLRQQIAAERQTLHAEAVKAIAHADLEKRRQKVMARMASKADAPGVHVARAQRRAARRAERLRAAIDNAAGIYLPDRLHEVRIAAKKLRYAIEMVRPAAATPRAGRPASKSLRSTAGQLAALKRAQDLLGRMHDLEMLITRTRAVQGTPQAQDLRLSGELDQLVRVLEMECRLLHGQYMATRGQLLDVCERVERHASRAA
jgi:CHAD domain-containing protein